jgi:peptide deformylase
LIVKCPKCGAKNNLPASEEPGATHRCGKCKAVLSRVPKGVGAKDGGSSSRESTLAAQKALARIAGIVLFCLTLVALAALAGATVTDRLSFGGNQSLSIVTYPNQVLSKVADPVGQIGEEEQRLAASMTSTVREWDIFGLAAPQVGVSTRIIVVRLDRPGAQQETLVMVNPEIVDSGGSARGAEWCPSAPGRRLKPAEIDRSEWISLRYLTLEGEEAVLEENGWNARAILHQIDHLDGKPFTDYSKPFDMTPKAIAATAILVVGLCVGLRLTSE